MGASIGSQGTIRGQSDLRRICALLNMIPLNRPEVFVSSVTDKIDESGNINDLETQQQIKQLLEAFTAWIRKIKS
jgi:chromate reductase